MCAGALEGVDDSIMPAVPCSRQGRLALVIAKVQCSPALDRTCTMADPAVEASMSALHPPVADWRSMTARPSP